MITLGKLILLAFADRYQANEALRLRIVTPQPIAPRRFIKAVIDPLSYP